MASAIASSLSARNVRLPNNSDDDGRGPMTPSRMGARNSTEQREVGFALTPSEVVSMTVPTMTSPPRVTLYEPLAAPDLVEVLDRFRRELRAMRRLLQSALLPRPESPRCGPIPLVNGLYLRRVHRRLLGAAQAIPRPAKQLSR